MNYSLPILEVVFFSWEFEMFEFISNDEFDGSDSFRKIC
jgi:hypothetical protein